jgi:2-polyprenyl-3-methyl-5-hydroxy-6-metoxy-1,4-benzoquinol methylase
MTGALITPGYLWEQKRLHAEPRGYGQRGRKWAAEVVALASAYRCASVLDYGCGAGSLGEVLRTVPGRLEVREYDPAIPGKDGIPTAAADLVVCTDVLEHVEAATLPAVLAHLEAVTGRVLFVVISLVPTAKTLSTGEQAHITLRPVAWWRAALEGAGFAVVEELPIRPDKQWVAVCRC